jgi:lipase chaperone LimK
LKGAEAKAEHYEIERIQIRSDRGKENEERRMENESATRPTPAAVEIGALSWLGGSMSSEAARN